MIFSGPQDRAYFVFELLNGSSLVLFELGLKAATPYFDAQLSRWPNISYCSPDFILVLRGERRQVAHLIATNIFMYCLIF